MDSTYFGRRHIDGNLPHGTGPGEFPVSGDENSDREAPAAAGTQEVRIHLGSGIKGAGRIQGDGGVNLYNAEHGDA